jgi:hypothetical protein
MGTYAEIEQSVDQSEANSSQALADWQERGPRVPPSKESPNHTNEKAKVNAPSGITRTGFPEAQKTMPEDSTYRLRHCSYNRSFV